MATILCLILTLPLFQTVAAMTAFEFPRKNDAAYSLNISTNPSANNYSLVK
jgi:hypothetical protein